VAFVKKLAVVIQLDTCRTYK